MILRRPWPAVPVFRPRTGVLAGLVVAALSSPGLGGPAVASDHADTPQTAADPAADLGDVYAWADGNTLTAAFTFAANTPPSANEVGTFDADVLYSLHIDADGDFQSDTDVRVRFGQNTAGEWGVQVENLPGAGGPVRGRVNSVISAGNGRFIFAGLRDDPFFADAQGLQESIAFGELRFDSARDTYAGHNATAVILEMDLAAASRGNTVLHVWATTGRK